MCVVALTGSRLNYKECTNVNLKHLMILYHLHRYYVACNIGVLDFEVLRNDTLANFLTIIFIPKKNIQN